MSTTINITEDFPSLPIQKKITKKDHNERSCSAASSMSSSSVGAFGYQKTNCVEVLPKGTYIAVEDLIVRPHLCCHCERCGAEWLTESQWAEARCQRAQRIAVDSGFVCKVLESKVVHHKVGFKRSEFSVARIQWEEHFECETFEDDVEESEVVKTKTFRGWCFSKCLQETHKQQIRSESTQRLNVDSRQEVDRSRSNSVASSYKPTSVFTLGEPVLAKIGAFWKRASVNSVDPLQAVVEGTGEVVSHLSELKKMTTRNFFVTKDISVRNTQLNDKWAVTTGSLEKGTTIAVCHTSGYDGFVTSPVCGWITMRSAHSLNVVNGHFVPQEEKPTIFVTNLPGDLTRTELREKLVREFQVDPKGLHFESNGTAYRAVLTLGSYEQALQLAKRKTFQIRFGWNLLFSWDLRYLQKRALEC